MAYCLKNICFLIFHYYTFKLISDHQQIFCLFFWKYISFFRHFFITFICNILWIILLWIFWKVCNSNTNFIINQINSPSAVFFSYSIIILSWIINNFLSFFWIYIYVYFFSVDISLSYSFVTFLNDFAVNFSKAL